MICCCCSLLKQPAWRNNSANYTHRTSRTSRRDRSYRLKVSSSSVGTKAGGDVTSCTLTITDLPLRSSSSLDSPSRVITTTERRATLEPRSRSLLHCDSKIGEQLLQFDRASACGGGADNGAVVERRLVALSPPLSHCGRKALPSIIGGSELF